MDRNPAVIVISSHVMRGTVGNRAAVLALETQGFDVWAVPTVVLPWHPGHGPSSRIIPEPNQFANALKELANSPWISGVGAILSGYFGDAKQVLSVAGLVKSVKASNPSSIFVCDPVIGDANSLYVPQDTAVAIRDHLIPEADIVTPNRFELEWLTGLDTSDPKQAVEAAEKLGPRRALVTSVGGSGEKQGNVLVTEEGVFSAVHEFAENAPNGTGDLTAALFIGHLLSGTSLKESLALSTATVLGILELTRKLGMDEMVLRGQASTILNPQTRVTVHDGLKAFACG